MPTSTKKDLYEILGVNRSSSDSDIKKAFRKLARKFHPDVNPGDKVAEQRFKEINGAYEILSDTKKRQQYDQFGHAAFEQGFGHGGPGGAGFEGFGGHSEEFFTNRGFQDIFENMFGGRQSRSRGPYKGDDITYTIEIGLEDAIFGKATQVDIERLAACTICKGSGAQSGTSPKTCATCRGRGSVTGGTGFLHIEQPCHVCRGSGTVIEHPCPSCGGSGMKPKSDRINVKIPPGVDNGSRVRVAGMGAPGVHGGPAGDVYIITRVRPHHYFERKGDNLYSHVKVTVKEAALGEKVPVPTVDSMVMLSLPAGVQTGQQFKLKGKGVPHLGGGGTGDHYVTVTVVTPTGFDERGRELLRELERLYPMDPRKDVAFKGFVRKR